MSLRKRMVQSAGVRVLAALGLAVRDGDRSGCSPLISFGIRSVPGR